MIFHFHIFLLLKQIAIFLTYTYPEFLPPPPLTYALYVSENGENYGRPLTTLATFYACKIQTFLVQMFPQTG